MVATETFSVCSICNQAHGDPRRAIASENKKACDWDIRLRRKATGGESVDDICGAIGLHWGKVTPNNPGDSGFRLFERDGSLHQHRPLGATVSAGIAAPVTPVKTPHKTPITDTPVSIPADLVARIDAIEASQKDIADGYTQVASAIETAVKERGERIDAELAGIRNLVNTARPIEVVTPTGLVNAVGRQHNQFENALRMMSAIGSKGILYVHGAAGSMKTSLLRSLADALGVPHYIQAFSQQTSEVRLIGYGDANGHYVESPTYKAWANGGIVLWDEFDNANGNVVAMMNALSSNGEFDFPVVGNVKRHPDCYIIAAGNTLGRGATAQYNVRTQLDLATLSRMVYLSWETDWEFVGEITGLTIGGDAPAFPPPGNPRTIAEYADWGEYVKRIALALPTIGSRAVVTSRAVLNGANLLAAGVDRGLVEYACIWAHMSEADADAVKAVI